VSVTVLDDRWFTARKPHFCSTCFGRIGAGDRYRRQRSVDGGDGPWTYKCHALCDQAYSIAYREAGCTDDEGPDDGEVREVLQRFWSALAGMLRVAEWYSR
jgi:hypothetical protein